MPSSCPSTAPRGSKWTIVGGRFQCRAPDGSIVPTGTTPLGQAPPPPVSISPGGTGGRTPVGGSPSPGSSPYVSLPGGYPGQPGAPFPGSGSPLGGGGGGSIGGSGVKGALVSGGLGLLGQLFNFFGKKRTVDAQNQNNTAAVAQQRADAEARARAGAGIYSNMLAHYGHGGLATPEQLFAALMRPPTPTVKVAGPSLFSLGGSVAEDASAGASDYFGMREQNQPQGTEEDAVQGEIWKQILTLILNRNKNTPVEGGSSIPDY